MKLNARTSILILAGIGVILFLPRLGGTAPIGTVPNYVLKSNGNAFGKNVIPNSSSMEFSLEDPNFGNPIPMRLRILNAQLAFEGTESRVWYSGGNCTGVVYIQDPVSSDFASSRLLGKSYGVGTDPGNSNHLSVFRSTGSSGTPPVGSEYVNGTCTTPAGFTGGDKVSATAIIDITTNFPGPYTLE